MERIKEWTIKQSNNSQDRYPLTNEHLFVITELAKLGMAYLKLALPEFAKEGQLSERAIAKIAYDDYIEVEAHWVDVEAQEPKKGEEIGEDEGEGEEEVEDEGEEE